MGCLDLTRMGFVAFPIPRALAIEKWSGLGRVDGTFDCHKTAFVTKLINACILYHIRWDNLIFLCPLRYDTPLQVRSRIACETVANRMPTVGWGQTVGY